MRKNITLIGMMGCGKTTIAKELANTLQDFKLVDIDDEIEKSTGKKISEIFLKYGEPHFRELENRKIKQFTQNDFQIISIGGGAFEDPENRHRLLENSTVFFLKANPSTIYERIKEETHRPILRKDFSVEKIQHILSLREKNYQLAHHTVITDNKTPKEIATEIIEVINA